MQTTRVLGLALGLALLISGTAFGGPVTGDLRVVTNNPPGNANCQAQPGGGCVTDAACVQEGDYGLRVTTVPGEAIARFVEADASNGFNDETVVRESFWFNPRSLQAGSNVKHFVNVARRTGGGRAPFRVIYFKNQGTDEHKLALACNANCPGGANCNNKRTTKVTLADDWNQILVEWAHSDPAPNPANGTCRISIIAGPAAPQTGDLANPPLRNTQALTTGATLGMSGAVLAASTDGDHCFDDYQSFRTLAPGP